MYNQPRGKYAKFIPSAQRLITAICIGYLFYIFLKREYLNNHIFINLETIIANHYKALLLFLGGWFFISEKTNLYLSERSLLAVLKRILLQLFYFSFIILAVSGLKSKILFSNELAWEFIFCLLIAVIVIHLLPLLFLGKTIPGNAIFIDYNNNTDSINKLIRREKNAPSFIKHAEFRKEANENIKNEFTFSPQAIIEHIKKYNIDTVFFFLNGELSKEIEYSMMKFSSNNKNIKILFIPDSNYDFYKNLSLDYYGVIPIFSTKESNVLWTKFLKRAFDLLFSFLFTVLILTWLTPLIALIIKLTSKGPVFFLQERVGIRGKPFNIIKFRSMYLDAEAGGPKLSSDSDSRITSIGKIIRKYRIDELPQFINVIKGDMSLVGPRPERQYFADQIIEKFPRYRELQQVKPGVTSIGQVYFGYAENIDEMVRRTKYDLLYLNHDNFFLDLKILYLTFHVMVQGKGK